MVINRIKLISGGIDSYIMSQQYEGKNVYVDFGQKYADEEKSALNKLGVEFDAIRIEGKFDSDEIFIPNRNLAMAALISMQYNADEIYMAGLKDDNCKDKTESEFERMSELLSRYAEKQVKVISPYWKITKGELVATFENKEKLVDTFSCYHPENGKPCGNCPACLRRTIALETNGIKSNVPLSDDIIKQYLSKIHLYDTDRISRFFIYLRNHGGVLALDIDGVLCREKGDYENRTNYKFNIENPFKYKVLYTARLESDREVTEQWLKKNGYEYDALIMNKLPYDLLIDDKAKRL